jgi:hypothetical protein
MMRDMNTSTNSALAYSERWLKIIEENSVPDRTLASEIIIESTENFEKYFNKELFANRKSTSLAKECGLVDGACIGVEWKGSGSHFEDILGRRYLDWL